MSRGESGVLLNSNFEWNRLDIEDRPDLSASKEAVWPVAISGASFSLSEDSSSTSMMIGAAILIKFSESRRGVSK